MNLRLLQSGPRYAVTTSGCLSIGPRSDTDLEQWRNLRRDHCRGCHNSWVSGFRVKNTIYPSLLRPILFYGLVILRHARRRLVTINVTSNPTAEQIAGQVTDAFPWNEAPHHLIRDRDGAFGPAYLRSIRAMGIRDHFAAPRSPWQKGRVERLIGSIRRESLDHLIVVRRSALAQHPESLRFLLQQGPDPSLTGQRCYRFSDNAEDRAHRSHSYPRRAPSSIRRL